MSNAANQANEIAQTIAAYDSIITNTSVGVAVMTLLSYEYLLLIGREVDTFWKRRVTGASVLFILNRYLPILAYVVQLVPVHRLSDKGCGEICSAIAILTILFTVLQYFPWAAFSALRAFALSEKYKWPISTFVFLLSAAPIGINFSRFRWLTSFNDPLFGCLVEVPAPPELAKRCWYSLFTSVTIISRTCLIVADITVIAVTWAATYRTSKLVRDAVGSGEKRTFSDTLLRDGTVYFVVLLLLNILHLTFTELSINFEALIPASYATIFAEPLTAILISRFLLNLQDANRQAASMSGIDVNVAQAADTLHFVSSRVIGPLGSSLSYSSDYNYRYETENMDDTVFEGISTVGVHSENGEGDIVKHEDVEDPTPRSMAQIGFEADDGGGVQSLVADV